MHDRHGALADDLKQRVFDGPANLEPAVRRSLGTGDGIPDELSEFARGLGDNPYRVGHEDVAKLLATGYTEDQVYEATISVALGAGARRLDIGLAAVAESFAAMPADATPPAPQESSQPVAPEVEQPFTPVVAVDPSAASLKRREPGVNMPGGPR